MVGKQEVIRVANSYVIASVGITSPFHSFTEAVGGFQPDTIAVTALPSMVTTTLKGVVIQSWQSRGRGGEKETT